MSQKIRGFKMGNLVCGAMGWNFFTALEHEKQGELSRVSTQRARLARHSSIWSRNVSAGANLARKEWFDAMRVLNGIKANSVKDGKMNEDKYFLAMLQAAQNAADAARLKYEAEQTKAEDKQEQIKEMVKAEDLTLELRQNELQQELTLLKQLKDAHKELFNSAAKDFKPQFGGG